ncbi:hypothetical protein Ga0074812_11755 [Parafrankia irregularis]|uniref:MMPL family protein n=1 Tax=Parafrankia irregularis TaxID=795642 RepID=A0A0S4QSZ3_9ACTN|nr:MULTISPECIES: hypothetical protein [Parafrankia]CUU58146.1 hypothetical protein Ga0074812_11755 [Parafrankia irregularis]
MFERLGRTVFRRRWWVLGLAGAFFVFGGVWGTQVFGELTTSGFDDPASESSRALERAEAALGRTGNDLVVLYRSTSMTVDDPAYEQAVTERLDALPHDVVTRTITYWVVIGLFSISGITFIKLIGVAMIIAIVVDATIVRALLVPATMRLLGNTNWWAPAPLRRFHARHGLHETPEAPEAPNGPYPSPDPPDPPDPRPAPTTGTQSDSAA